MCCLFLSSNVRLPAMKLQDVNANAIALTIMAINDSLNKYRDALPDETDQTMKEEYIKCMSDLISMKEALEIRFKQVHWYGIGTSFDKEA